MTVAPMPAYSFELHFQLVADSVRINGMPLPAVSGTGPLLGLRSVPCRPLPRQFRLQKQ